MLQKLIEIAREAGDAALAIQRRGNVKTYGKEDEPRGSNFATDGDLAAQAIIIERLTTTFPDIPIVAEEQENQTIIKNDSWLVDPVDGTTTYSNGGEDWGVMITRLSGGFPSQAVVYLPARQLMLHAETGHGCYLNGEQKRIDYNAPIEREKTIIGIEIGPWWGDDAAVRLVQLPLQKEFPIVSRCSTAGGFADLIGGKTKAWLSLKCGKPWDFAPGYLLIKEAGGVATGANGAQLDFTRLASMDVVYSSSHEITDTILPLTKAWAMQL